MLGFDDAVARGEIFGDSFFGESNLLFAGTLALIQVELLITKRLHGREGRKRNREGCLDGLGLGIQCFEALLRFCLGLGSIRLRSLNSEFDIACVAADLGNDRR